MVGDGNQREPQDANELIRFVEDLKRQWVSTIDALVDPLMIVSKDYTIHKANKAMARQGSLDVKDVVGKRCYEVFGGRSSPCVGCALQKTASTPTSTTFELEHIHGDRFYEVSSQPLFNSNGELENVVHVYRDRTEAKRLQEQLAQQEKLASIGLLAGGVAHEINNPLGGILIFSQMMLREMPKDSPHYQDVVEIEAATQRCKGIVDSLLDFARQNPHDQSLSDYIDTVEAIRTAVRFAKVGLKNNVSVELHEEFSGDDHLIHADRNKVVQMFLNLIQNAIHAMPDGGTITIRASKKMVENENLGLYEIEDTGVGIPPQNLKKIFDPFFTTKDPGEGTGLGLALCYSIVQDIGGKMWVESTLNVGTRFFIEFPLKAADKVSRPAS